MLDEALALDKVSSELYSGSGRTWYQNLGLGGSLDSSWALNGSIDACGGLGSCLDSEMGMMIRDLGINMSVDSGINMGSGIDWNMDMGIGIDSCVDMGSGIGMDMNLDMGLNSGLDSEALLERWSWPC